MRPWAPSRRRHARRTGLAGLALVSVMLYACGSPESAHGPLVRVEGAWARVATLLPSPESEASPEGADSPESATPGGADAPGGANVPEGPRPSGTNSAVYMVLVNDGNVADRLLGGRSAVARAVELHESRMEGGVMTMRPLDGVDLPPNQTVTFRPAGRHFMLVDLNRGLAEGDTVDMVLELERSGPLSLRIPVRMAGEG